MRHHAALARNDPPERSKAVVQEYNDYIKMTRDYLRHYNSFLASAACLRERIAALKEEAGEEPAAAIAKYGGQPQGGYSVLNGVESEASRLLAVRDKISQYETDLRILEHKIKQIDIAMSVLDDIDKRIVKECYINHRYYYQVGEIVGLSEKWTAQRAQRAVKEMACVLFGHKAVQCSLFVFADCG